MNNICKSNLRNSIISELISVDETGKASINFGFNSGGYEKYVFFVTASGNTISIDTVLKRLHSETFNDPDDEDLYIVAYNVNYENASLYDSLTDELIECAYSE